MAGLWCCAPVSGCLPWGVCVYARARTRAHRQWPCRGAEGPGWLEPMMCLSRRPRSLRARIRTQAVQDSTLGFFLLQVLGAWLACVPGSWVGCSSPGRAGPVAVLQGGRCLASYTNNRRWLEQFYFYFLFLLPRWLFLATWGEIGRRPPVSTRLPGPSLGPRGGRGVCVTSGTGDDAALWLWLSHVGPGSACLPRVILLGCPFLSSRTGCVHWWVGVCLGV